MDYNENLYYTQLKQNQQVMLQLRGQDEAGLSGFF